MSQSFPRLVRTSDGTSYLVLEDRPTAADVLRLDGEPASDGDARAVRAALFAERWSNVQRESDKALRKFDASVNAIRAVFSQREK